MMELESAVRRFLLDFDAGEDVSDSVAKLRNALPTIQLHRAIYTSRSLISPSDDAELLEQSRINNLRIGITGILLRHQNHYIQVIEGDRADVLGLVEKIKRDKRHADFLLVSTTEIECRNFANWQMALATLSATEWTEWLTTFGDGQRYIDKLIASFVDGRYRKSG